MTRETLADEDDGPREVVDHHWTPDNPDGSGWADIDWVSAVRGSRYHYSHGAPKAEALAALPAFFCVVTRLESRHLIPHENRYYLPGPLLGDVLVELSLAGGIEHVWHVEPCPNPPDESRVRTLS